MTASSETAKPESAAPGQINYSALQQAVQGPQRWRHIGVTGLLIIPLSILVGGSLNAAAGDTFTSVMTSAGLYIGGITAAIGYGVYFWKKSAAEQAAFEKFLADNGWGGPGFESFDDVATSLLGVGRDEHLKHAFSGRYHGLTFRGLVYEYTTGSGKSQQTHSIANLHFILSQQFPLLLLDDKKNNTWMFSDLPNRIDGGKQLQVEGDFNSRYKLTVLPGTEQEVLQLLTPDFMAELMNNPEAGDIELEADKLFIICPSGNLNYQTIFKMFTTADIVLKHLNEVADTWQASSSPESMETMAATALTPRSQVFKARHVGIATLAGVALYLIFLLLQLASR